MTKCVALTGATGFAGRHVASVLSACGFNVRCLIRDQAKAAGLPAGQHVSGALEDNSAIDRLLDNVDVLVHLAGAIAAPDRKTFLNVNENGSRRVAEAAVRHRVRRVIHVSSLAAREPLVSDYAFSKQAGEAAVAELRNHFSLAILRPPAIYGPGDRATLPLFAQLTRRFAFIPGSRQQRFSLLYVDDFARVISSLVESSWSGISEIDDGKSGGYDWNDLISCAKTALGRPITPLFLPEQLLRGLSWLVNSPGLPPIGKINELYHLDWVCRGQQPELDQRIGFEAGFRQTLNWYRQEGWLPGGVSTDKTRSNHQGELAA